MGKNSFSLAAFADGSTEVIKKQFILEAAAAAVALVLLKKRVFR